MFQVGYRHCAFERRKPRIFLHVMNIFEDEILHEHGTLGYRNNANRVWRAVWPSLSEVS